MLRPTLASTRSTRFEQPVDAQADFKPVGGRLEMDVGGAALDGVVEQLVDEHAGVAGGAES